MRHIAFIMDGNGRWATKRNLPRTKGHEVGAQALLQAIEDMNGLKVECVSFYAFSTENSNRNQSEVSNILGVIAYFLDNGVSQLIDKYNLNVRVIGNFNNLPNELLDAVCRINSKSINNDGMTVVLAIGYGGEEEICDAVNKIFCERLLLRNNSPITKEEISNALYTAYLPNPDMVIRYGGYQRLSNFMPLQTVYSELFFLETLWPDYNFEEVKNLIEKFNLIKRNFGGING